MCDEKNRSVGISIHDYQLVQPSARFKMLPLFIIMITTPLSATSAATSSATSWMEHHSNLQGALLSSYNRKTRPSTDGNTTEVQIKFNPFNLNFLDEKSESLNMKAMFDLIWFDIRLQWNASDYGAIDHLDLPQTDLWLPPVQVFNSLSASGQFGFDEQSVRVYSTGQAYWIVINIIETKCVIDISYYPFDTQTCDVMVHFPGKEVEDVRIIVNEEDPMDSQRMSLNPTWEFVGGSAQQDFSGHKGNYQMVEFMMTFQRRTSFYVLNIILPVGEGTHECI